MGTSPQQQGRCLGWQLQLAESHTGQGLAAMRLLLACHIDQLWAHLLHSVIAQGHLMHSEAASALATGNQQLCPTCGGQVVSENQACCKMSTAAVCRPRKSNIGCRTSTFPLKESRGLQRSCAGIVQKPCRQGAEAVLGSHAEALQACMPCVTFPSPVAPAKHLCA